MARFLDALLRFLPERVVFAIFQTMLNARQFWRNALSRAGRSLWGPRAAVAIWIAVTVAMGILAATGAILACRGACEGAKVWHLVQFCRALSDSPPWTLVSALAAAPSLILTWYWRTVHKDKEIATEALRLELDRFVRAVELLADDKDEAKMGGIYALERIARDPESTPQDASVVTSLLSAFVRQRARLPDVRGPEAIDENAFVQRTYVEPPFTVVAAVQAVGRLPPMARTQSRIDLRLSGLYSVRLDGNYEGADFDGAVLAHAVLSGVFVLASFKGTDLTNADLSEAIISLEQVEQTNLTRGMKPPKDGYATISLRTPKT